MAYLEKQFLFFSFLLDHLERDRGKKKERLYRPPFIRIRVVVFLLNVSHLYVAFLSWIKASGSHPPSKEGVGEVFSISSGKAEI